MVSCETRDRCRTERCRRLGRGARLQFGQFDIAARPTRPRILLGDLNVTPWGAAFGTLLRRAGLRDSAAGHGMTSTWLTRWRVFGLTIDHSLAGPGFSVVCHEVGPDLGSDHLPVIAILSRRRSLEFQDFIATVSGNSGAHADRVRRGWPALADP